MQKSIRRLILISCTLMAIAILSSMTVTPTQAQTNDTQATIVGQVNVNGVATNGVTVTCGTGSATTSSYNGVDGVYVIPGQATGISLPFSATYQGHTFSDTIDPLTAGQQYYEIPVVNIDYAASTPTPTAAPTATVTPTPVANATVTPTPAANATVTPTPAANATVTPTPATNATVTPTPTVTPTATPIPATPTPAPVAAAPPQSPGDSSPPAATPVPTPVQSTPIPTNIVDSMSLNDSMATESTMGAATATPQPLPSNLPAAEPTTARSPGFAAVLALACLSGAACLARRKWR